MFKTPELFNNQNLYLQKSQHKPQKDQTKQQPEPNRRQRHRQGQVDEFRGGHVQSRLFEFWFFSWKDVCEGIVNWKFDLDLPPNDPFSPQKGKT